MTKRRQTRLPVPGGIWLALALAACSSNTPEQAVRDTSTAKVLTGEAFLTGLGLETPGTQRAKPDNRPRANLVVPPSRSLPPPEENDILTASTAAWPQDQDKAAARRRAELAVRSNNDSTDFDALSERLRVERSVASGNMRLSRRDPADRVSANQYENQVQRDIENMRRGSRLAREIKKQQSGKTRVARRTLIDPPVDYGVAPENAPPPPEKKKRRWWPF